MTHAEVEEAVRQFEGLVHETARQILDNGVEMEFDDIRQLLRIKVWKAVNKFDARRAAESKHLSRARDRRGRSPLQRYVFICIANERKEIESRPRRFNSSMDELRDMTMWPDQFDAQYLSVDAETVYADAGYELPLSELTSIERQVVMLRMEGLLLCEIDRQLGLSRAQRERVLESVREKLAHLNPASEPRNVPMPPLPNAEFRQRPAPALLAA